VIDMLISLAAVAVVVLIGLAVRIGDLQAKEQAWDRIAAERRNLAELRRALDQRAAELYQWESELVRAADSAACPVCALRRQRGLPPTDV
jgi:hypothetical protein